MAKPKNHGPRGKKKEGNAAKYTTRNKALNRLQIKLPEFRRLCILKGIHPREPKKKFEGNNKTYYHVKDINFLAHEPLLEKSREIKVFERKIKKARAKKNSSLAARLEANRPSYSLDHLVKERYPSFTDALRDLDDPLTMLHLFATFPAEAAYKIPAETVNKCRRLSLEWQAYVARTHTLRRTFISVKGIYYQAEVAGQRITWLTPHVLSQVVPDDVDIRVMLTFVEFYETLVGFVNFKLYHSMGLKYPPILDSQLEAEAAELYAVMRDLGREGEEVRNSNEESSTLDTQDDTAIKEDVDSTKSELRLAESKARLASLQDRLSMMTKDDTNAGSERPVEDVVEENMEEDEDEDTRLCKGLFKNLKFFLGREVPRESLLFLIRSFGGVASWSGDKAPFEESDEEITHQIVDRPSQGHMFLSREYIQPQWVYDCINARILLPTRDYVLGRVPPPHLSPFVDNDKEGYLPEYAETIKRLQGASNNKVLPLPGEEGLDDSNSFLEGVVAQRTETMEAVDKNMKEAFIEKMYKEELEKELAGISYSESVQSKDKSAEEEYGGELASNVLVQDDGTPLSIAQAMMPRKARKLYQAMQIGKAKKKAEVELLKERKRKAEVKHTGKAGKQRN
eukprot:c29005_g1_i1 orf=919-2790(-)